MCGFMCHRMYCDKYPALATSWPECGERNPGTSQLHHTPISRESTHHGGIRLKVREPPRLLDIPILILLLLALLRIFFFFLSFLLIVRLSSHHRIPRILSYSLLPTRSFHCYTYTMSAPAPAVSVTVDSAAQSADGKFVPKNRQVSPNTADSAIGWKTTMPASFQAAIADLENLFVVDTACLKKVVAHFVKELEKGELYWREIIVVAVVVVMIVVG